MEMMYPQRIQAGKTAKVRTFERGGVDYIRSDRDDTKKDNLGNLPKFSC